MRDWRVEVALIEFRRGVVCVCDDEDNEHVGVGRIAFGTWVGLEITPRNGTGQHGRADAIGGPSRLGWSSQQNPLHAMCTDDVDM